MAYPLEKRRSALPALKKAKGMTMVIFLLSPVESCGGCHGVSSREGEVCPSSPKKEQVMTMAFFLLSSMESCEAGHGLCYHLLDKRRSALLVIRRSPPS